MKIVPILFILISLLILSNCKRYDDTVLTIQVLSYADSLGVNDVPVFVYKRKYSLIATYGTPPKLVDSYYGITDKNGVCKIVIDNYNREKYWFDVEVNPNLESVAGGVFSHVGKTVEENELDEVLLVWGSIIPLPDPIYQGP